MKAKLLFLGLGIVAGLVVEGIYETWKTKKEEKEFLLRKFREVEEVALRGLDGNLDLEELRKFESWLHLDNQSTGWLINHIYVSRIIELYDMFKKK